MRWRADARLGQGRRQGRGLTDVGRGEKLLLGGMTDGSYARWHHGRGQGVRIQHPSSCGSATRLRGGRHSGCGRALRRVGLIPGKPVSG